MTVAPSISELDVRALWHPLTQHKPLADNPPPLIVRGEGCYLEDDQGRRYLDAMAGLWCVNIGYGRQRTGRNRRRADDGARLSRAHHDPHAGRTAGR